MINSTALPSGEMQCEINPCDKHKQDGDNLDRRAIKKRHACIVGRKPANRDCREAVGYCIETRHARRLLGGAREG